MHAGAVVARQRGVPRGGAASLGSLAFGVGRRAPPRGARAAAERTRQRCAPQAGRGAGRRAAPLGPAPAANTSTRCCGRCSRRTGASTGCRPPRASTDARNCHDAARVYVAAGRSRSARRCSSCRLPAGDVSISRCCSSRCSCSSSVDGGAQSLRCRSRRAARRCRCRMRWTSPSLLLLGPHETMLVAAGSAVQPVPAQHARKATRSTARCSAWRRW